MTTFLFTEEEPNLIEEGDFFSSFLGGDVVVVVEEIKHSNFSDVVFPYKPESGLVDFLVDIFIELGEGVLPPYLVDLSTIFPFNWGVLELEVLLLLDDIVLDVETGEVERGWHVRTPSVLLIEGAGGWCVVFDFLISLSLSKEEDFDFLFVVFASTPELTVSDAFIFLFLRFSKTFVFLKIR